jgi:predicted esterase
VIDIQYGKELCDSLEHLEMNVEWHQYDHGGHWVPEPEGIGEYLLLKMLRNDRS